MRKKLRVRRVGMAAACVGLSVSTTACSTLLRAGLGAAGVEESEQQPTLERPSQQTRPDNAVTSRYQHAPTLDWQGSFRARPASLVTSLFQNPAFDGRCQPIPIGLQQLTQIVDGAPAEPIKRIGPFEIGVQGPAALAFTPGYFDRVRYDSELLYSAAALADQGAACGFQSQLYVRLGLSKTAPLPIHR